MTGERVSANGEDSERTSWSMTMHFEGVSPELWRLLTGIEPTPIYDRVLAKHQERWRIARDAQEDSEMSYPGGSSPEDWKRLTHREF
jgi:hypothetical protein